MSVSEITIHAPRSPAAPQVSRWVSGGWGKRALDILASAAGLLVLSPLLVGVALLIKLTSRGPALFRQERVGRRFRPFVIYKFRTMVQDAPARGGVITVGEDPRITRLGRFLRKTKIDEFPQLLNVLKGDMSLVGPRPEAPRYVEMFRKDYEVLLEARPGITDLASLKYRNEAALLATAADPLGKYVAEVLPDKILLARYYLGQASFSGDVAVILRTVLPMVPFTEPGGEA
ncbi:MAG: sugar transferase [Planctomycetes bacterium]|nr:sugar transferase [Planctomycetota bacterium]